jgi:uncharacterized metal-binding protein
MSNKFPQCAKCPSKACYRNESNKPDFCPVILYPDLINESMKEYENEFIKNIHKLSTIIEKEGYSLELERPLKFAKDLILRKLELLFV